MSDRRAFLSGIAATALISACRPASEVTLAPTESPMSTLPVLFVGHGSPLNAIADNAWAEGFSSLGAALPRPTAILVISAHWESRGTLLTGSPWPETIHDFRGFPTALHEMQYPAPGAPELAESIATTLKAERAKVSGSRGLDHGCWAVLCRMFPAADIPVLQLSLDRNLSPAQHLALASRLAGLREQGVLVIGSGNIVHNLPDAIGRKRARDTATPDWAATYDAEIAAALEQHDDAAILDRAPDISVSGRMSHPTAEHWLPLLYAMGAATGLERVDHPITGFDWGSISMRSVRWS